MGEHPLRRLLSKAQATDPTGWTIVYTHRGAPGDKIEVALPEISKIRRGSFLLKDAETPIPYHRVHLVIDGKGVVRWKKRELGQLRAQDPPPSISPVSQAPPRRRT